MSKDFTELLMDSIVKQLILPSVDNYGNKQDSPVDRAITKYAQDYSEDIKQAVFNKLSVDKIASKVAENVYERITAFGGSYSSYDRENYKKELNTAITQKLAEKIAYRLEQDEKAKIKPLP